MTKVMNKLSSNVRILNWLAIIALAINLGMIFFFAPVERSMGNVQRILYFHVGSAWVAAVTFLVAMLAGIIYLRRPDKSWDTIAVASVEIGMVFVTMTIISGSVWARPAWNKWWVWEPRLTSITVMWLVYAAYFILRSAIDNEERRGRFSSVYVIAAFVTVIMTYFSIRILRSIHPVVVGGTLESAQGATQGDQEFASGIESARMGITLLVSTITFSLIYIAWLANRFRLQNLIDKTESLKIRVMTRLQS